MIILNQKQTNKQKTPSLLCIYFSGKKAKLGIPKIDYLLIFQQNEANNSNVDVPAYGSILE